MNNLEFRSFFSTSFTAHKPVVQRPSPSLYKRVQNLWNRIKSAWHDLAYFFSSEPKPRPLEHNIQLSKPLTRESFETEKANFVAKSKEQLPYDLFADAWQQERGNDYRGFKKFLTTIFHRRSDIEKRKQDSFYPQYCKHIVHEYCEGLKDVREDAPPGTLRSYLSMSVRYQPQ